ncbi:DUF6447 family protein [Synechococcus sp. CS-197]|uniref:DUF6447 family protein n=1 Tax=Synechococcus sp. CS-197 TaxID=2847985 RepID=UPI0001525CBD|nr:hypothetical protein DBR45_08780 [Pseudomonas sp. HMWF031]CAK23923.1 Conserved hypothetical protein [Synechococcus sp. WH 7803]
MIWKTIISKAFGLLDESLPQSESIIQTSENTSPTSTPTKVIIFDGKKYDIEQLDDETKVISKNLQSADRCINTHLQKAKLSKAAISHYVEQLRPHLDQINSIN